MQSESDIGIEYQRVRYALLDARARASAAMEELQAQADEIQRRRDVMIREIHELLRDVEEKLADLPLPPPRYRDRPVAMCDAVKDVEAQITNKRRKLRFEEAPTPAIVVASK